MLQHFPPQDVFFLETVVYLAVFADRLCRKKSDIGMQGSDHLFRVMPDEHRTVGRGDVSARRIGFDVVAGEQGQGVDAVGHHFDVFEIGQVFGDEKSGRGAVEKDKVAVFDQPDGRQGYFFLFQAVLVGAEGEAREEVVFIVDPHAAVRTGHQSFFLQFAQFSADGGGADVQIFRQFFNFHVPFFL